MNTNFQTNPFQQNVDILKGFFKRPIVLVTAILMGVSSLLSMFSGFFINSTLDSFVKNSINSMPDEFREYMSHTSTPNTNFGFSLPVLAILTTIAFFLFYFFSNSNSKDLKVPSTMFKVVSIIELVFVCVTTGIALLALIVMMIVAAAYGSYASNEFSYGSSYSFVYGVLIGLIIFVAIAMGIAIWYSAVKVKYACSIKKSTNSINLFKNGAKIFGVLTIIAGGISGLGTLSTLAIPGMGFAVFSGLVSAASNILFGVTAIQYANYINEISVNFTTQPPYGAVNPEPFNPQAPVQPPYGTPYTPPTQPEYEPYQPQPVAPVEQAPEVNAYEPVEEPVAEDVAPTEEAVETDKFCSACGNPVKADDYFCNNCGNKLK